jgi:hypothetical protein
MPDPKDNAKMTGDAHPPELENSGPPAAEEGDEVESTPGRGENQAGFLKDREGTGSGRDKNYG